MNVGSWLELAKKRIDGLDAELIAVKSFAPSLADRSWLMAHEDQRVLASQRKKADGMLEKRCQGVPMAYILGEKEFYGRKFRVKPGVLIPRPETEVLIDLIKELPLPKHPHFYEVGTGSGCIAITLALEYPQSYVLATDISSKALRIAEENDVLHEGRIDLAYSNLVKDLEFGENPEHFDVVVANLPYVNKEWNWVDEANLAYEPATALYAKSNNGLSTYQRFLRELAYYKGSDGLWMDYLVIEADPCQHVKLIKMAEKAGFVHLKTEGFGLVFEDTWRYLWDWRDRKFVRKSDEVIEKERKSGEISFILE